MDAAPLARGFAEAAAPRAGVPLAGTAPRFAGVFGAVGGGETADRTFEMLDAVGLNSRSATSALSVAFFTGGGGASGPFRALASDAAVGANRPEAGVFGLVVGAGVFDLAADAGVFGRVTAGVFERPGVTGGRTDALDEGREVGALAPFVLLDVRSM